MGIPEDYDAFDVDVILNINSTLAYLNELGIGPRSGLMITGDESWDALLGGDPRLNHVKMYVFLKTKLTFDPPGTANLVTAYQEQIKELEWRLIQQPEFQVDSETPPAGGTVSYPPAGTIQDYI